LDVRAMCDLELIAVGALSPLEGFMGRADYRSVLERGRLASGLPWTVPITLSLRKGAGDVAEGRPCSLRAPDGRLLAVMQVEERFELDKPAEAAQVYRTSHGDGKHPGVAYLYSEMGDVAIGGSVHFL